MTQYKKVFRDPIYGYIQINHSIISDLIDTKEFQRLRRIRQLSGVCMVFHTAEHTRFSHALGAYEVARRLLENAMDVKKALSEKEQMLFLISALLHDIGHGPYSHCFESVFKCNHEVIGTKIIMGNTEINQVLNQYDANLAREIKEILLHENTYPLIESLISSQLDVDRIDYLQRDAYFTGAVYGRIDIDRIFRVMTVFENKIVFKPTSVHTIESYLMSRYHMYWQVYFHPTARNYEIILEMIYKRIKHLIQKNYDFKTDIETLKTFISDQQNLEAYIDMDDSYINGMIKTLTKTKDLILNELCNSFMNRKLFKIAQSVEDFKKLETLLLDEEYKAYFYKEEQFSQAAYYQNHEKNDIRIIMPNQDLILLEAYSPIVKGLIDNSYKTDRKIYFKER